MINALGKKFKKQQHRARQEGLELWSVEQVAILSRVISAGVKGNVVITSFIAKAGRG